MSQLTYIQLQLLGIAVLQAVIFSILIEIRNRGRS